MGPFKKIYIEITNLCNLSCSFCPKTKRRGRYMKPGEYRSILGQIKPYTDYVYLHVKGEPLMHPLLGEILDASHEMGFRVNMTTNGTLIHKLGPLLLTQPALRQVNFSLHSLEEEKQPVADLARMEYLSRIISFARQGADRGIYISLRLWNLEAASHSQKGSNRRLLDMLEERFNLDFHIGEKIVPGSGVKLAERIYLNQDFRFEWPDLQAMEDSSGGGYCHGLRSHAAILADGTVVPCCLDGEGVMSLGNIHRESFADIIEGERAQRIAEGFTRREVVEELCRKCGYRKRFGAKG